MLNTVNSRIAELHPNISLFGLLLFTEQHPNLIKVLRDPDYYNALNSVSGDSFAIFSTVLFPGHMEMPSPPPGMICFLVPVWKEPTANKELLHAFELTDSRSLPQLAVFGFEGSEMHYHLYSLEVDSVETAFSSLNTALKSVCDGDARPTFEQARKRLKMLTVKKSLKKIFELVEAVSSLREAASSCGVTGK